MAAVPYAEYQKLSLWWLGFSQYELEKRLIVEGGNRGWILLIDFFMTLVWH